MSAANPLPAAQRPATMTVAEFLVWTPPDFSDRWELIDGTPRAMSPAAPPHGFIQAEAARLIGNHLLANRSSCRVATEHAVQPRVRGDFNVRVPDLAVTCTRTEPGERLLREPVVVIEILSPSNRSQTWQNVWSYTTIPSVREILVLHAAEVRAELLRRQADGTWPDNPVTLTTGDIVTLASIDFAAPVAALYRTV